MLGRVFMGRYETVRLLGEGGMGKVFLARQLDLGRQVVVKVMHDHIAADPKFRERFARETLLMARFQHPYAVTLYDASLNDPQGPCIVMEYIRGVSLDQLLSANGRLTPSRVSRLLFMLCEVLQAAHQAGIVHRDLKPANLMIVDPDTPYELLKVMDFGLAKLLGPGTQGRVTITNTEFAVGTPGYMCPEQARGEEMDGRGDLYSVGIILYEVLTGQLPFRGKSTMEVLLAQVTEEPPPFAFTLADHGVPEPIERVVRLCLSKDPNQRPRNARALAELFEAALRGKAPESPEPLRSLPGRPETVIRPGAAPAPAPAAVDNGGEPPAAPTERKRRSSRPAAKPAPSHPVPPLRSLEVRPVPAGPTDEPRPARPSGEPLDVVHHLEAWMPEKIAAFKLRGFVGDVGGDILESSPGRIHVRVGGPGSIYSPGGGSLAWLGLGRGAPIDMTLHLEHGASREGQLFVTVVFRPAVQEQAIDIGWRNLCTRIFCDLRAYLMGQTGSLRTEPIA
jgi:serine/threonine-protein kinase